MRQSFLALAVLGMILSIGAIASQNAYASTAAPTETPTELNATAISPTQITLTWLPPTQNYGKVIMGYKIEKMIGGGVFDTLVPNTASTFPNFSVTGLKTGTTYTFRVSAVYTDDTTTEPSNWASATPKTTSTQAPPPQALPAPSSNSTQAANEKFDFTPADGTTLYGAVLTQTDYGQLLAKKEQRSIISNSMQTAQSINSNVDNVLTYQDSHQTSPAVPAPLIATATSPTQITLSWLAPEETYGGGIIGYKIEWKQANGAYVPVEDNTQSTDTKYVINGLATGTTYTYRASAIYSSETISNPSNEASATPLAPVQSVTSTTQTGQNSQAQNNSQNTQPSAPVQQSNIEFDLTVADGTKLNGVVITQSEYQQLIVIKDPRDIISNVTMTGSSINNDLSGILRYQNLHIPAAQQAPQTNITQPAPAPAPSPAPTVALDDRVLEGVVISVISSGAVGIITWLVKTKVTKKIANEYHFTIEKFILDASTHIRIRNSGQTIEDCTILCDRQVCIWTDTNLDKPRHILEGSISVARLPIDMAEGSNPLITVKSGKKVLRKSYLDAMSHG